VYDIPYRTGVQIHRDTLLTLARHPQIAALKDCGGDAGKTLALIAQGELQVLAGEDLQIFATVAQGGVGAIAACAHVATRRFMQVITLLRAGQMEAARALWLPMAPLIEALFAEPNPAPVKALLAHQGLLQPGLRAPMTGCTPAHAAHLVRVVDGL
jgi:4-hydroxy-tetrahydrodipicolinate synthase